MYSLNIVSFQLHCCCLGPVLNSDLCAGGRRGERFPTGPLCGYLCPDYSVNKPGSVLNRGRTLDMCRAASGLLLSVTKRWILPFCHKRGFERNKMNLSLERDKIVQ